MWKHLKEKYKQFITTVTYEDIIRESLGTMFVYDGAPETLNTDYLEQYLILNGMVGIYKDKSGNIICSEVSMGGKPDVYGVGTTPITTTQNGQNKTWESTWKKDGLVVGWNNNLHVPDMNIGRFASLLADVDLSLYYNLIYSRLLPMPTASSADQKRAIEDAFKAMLEGKPQVILSDNILADIVNGGKGIEVVNLTDVEASTKIQYLSHFHDDLIRRLYTMYGVCSANSTKMAQQSVDEINTSLAQSFIIPLDRLAHRQKMIDEINATFGLNMTVRFSEPLLIQWNRQDENPNDNGPDELDNTPDDESSSHGPSTDEPTGPSDDQQPDKED